MFNCATCCFSVEGARDLTNIKAPRVFECRRFPAQLLALPIQTGRGMAITPVSAFPTVQAEQHCGEWKQAALKGDTN